MGKPEGAKNLIKEWGREAADAKISPASYQVFQKETRLIHYPYFAWLSLLRNQNNPIIRKKVNF